jgi:hypothetical protein
VYTFLIQEESLARKRLVGIASSSLVEGNPGRKKKVAERREVFSKLVSSFDLLGLEDWWCSVIAVYAKYC